VSLIKPKRRLSGASPSGPPGITQWAVILGRCPVPFCQGTVILARDWDDAYSLACIACARDPRNRVQWCAHSGCLGGQIAQAAACGGRLTRCVPGCTSRGPAVQSPLAKRGRREGGQRVLSDDQIRQVLYRRQHGEARKVVARDYGVSVDTIWRVERGQLVAAG
jgi:hypothetical protein